MKYLLICIMILPLMLGAQNANTTKFESKTADEFINLFYQSQADVDDMQLFFKPQYFNTFFEFREHMILKNLQYGHFVNKQLIKQKEQLDGNVIYKKFKINYSKGSMEEEIILKRTCPTCSYKITKWKTKRV